MSKEQQALASELHATARKKYATMKVVTLGIDDLWQADLVDMQELSKSNRGFKYLLTVIDTFSKFSYGIPLKNKSAKEVSTAFKELLKEKVCKNLHTDKGKEFFNQHFQALMKEYNINHYHTFSKKKASIVERFNRTLKTRMWKKFTELNTYNWVDMLDKLISNYNDTYHSTIKMKPKEVNSKNETEVWKNIYGKKQVKGKILFKVGDLVRISKEKGIFEKGYKFNWSEELFKIKEVRNTRPVTYKIEDLSGETIEGSFYNQELQKTKIPNYARIEKVLRKKTVNGKLLYRVKWKGYDNKFNQWIPAENVENINLIK